MTTATSKQIITRVRAIAHAAWDDRSEATRKLPLAEQIRSVANTPALGTDGDLSSDDVTFLLALADEDSNA